MTKCKSAHSRLRQVSIVAIGALLTACATIQRDPLILVGKTGFSVYGRTVQSQVELTGLLVENSAHFVEVRPEAGAGYEQVRQAMAAVQKAGAKIRIVGNIRDE